MVRRFGFYMGAALLVSVSWPVTPSHAGFEFVAPINQEPAKQQVLQVEDQNEILEQSDVEPLLPLMSTKDTNVQVEPLSVLPTQMKLAPTPPPAPMAIIEKDVPPVAAAMPMKTPKPAMKSSFDASVVEGFASQIPLAIALQQVIPPQYKYAFADGVNAGEKVDWQGGKPWDQVVSDMVADKGMDVEISGNVVYIRRQGMVRSMPVALPESVMKPVSIEEKIPLLPSETARPTSVNRSQGILFDSPEMADLSGVTRLDPKPALQSNRLNFDELSIGQPMDLVSETQKKTISSGSAKEIVTKKKILTAKAPKVAPAFDKKAFVPKAVELEKTVDILPKVVPMPLAPVKNKSILLDDAPAKSEIKPVFPSEPIHLGNPITPIEEMPVAKTVEMSEAAMNIMRPATASVVSMETSTWQANSGETLRSVLEKWTNETETSLIWEASYDYPLQADIEISGTFEVAVRTLLDGLSEASPRPLGRLHRNDPSGQSVLVIETEALTN